MQFGRLFIFRFCYCTRAPISARRRIRRAQAIRDSGYTVPITRSTGFGTPSSRTHHLVNFAQLAWEFKCEIGPLSFSLYAIAYCSI